MVQRLFDNTKIDSLAIHLDDTPALDPTTGCPIFNPLQVVSGNVMWTTRTSRAVDDVVIVFRGWCKTRIAQLADPKDSTKRTSHVEEMELFRIELKLVKRNTTFNAGSYEWPFRFVFPQRSNSAVIRNYGDLGNKLFHKNPHMLPPTMLSEGSPWDTAEVGYVLDVKVNTNNYHPVDAFLPLILVTQRKEPLPELINSFVGLGIDKWQSKKLRTEKFTIPDKLYLLYKRAPILWEVPVLSISATISIPSFASIWQPWPLLLSLQQHRDSLDDPDHPAMALQQIVLELEAHTDIRVSTQVGDFSTSLKYIAGILRIRGSQAPPIKLDNQLVLIKNDIRLGDMLPVKDMVLVPTFKSYTINHRYKIRIKVHVMHEETGHVFQYETVVPFQVLELPRGEKESLSMEELARLLEWKKEDIL